MPRGAERDSLRGIAGVGLAGEVSGDQPGDIDQLRLIDGFSGKLAYFLGHGEETSSPAVMCDRFPESAQPGEAVRRDLCGAGDRFRTDDLVLGKHALYQLSYTRSPNRRDESI